jgi:hypothetical protein
MVHPRRSRRDTKGRSREGHRSQPRISRDGPVYPLLSSLIPERGSTHIRTQDGRPHQNKQSENDAACRWCRRPGEIWQSGALNVSPLDRVAYSLRWLNFRKIIASTLGDGESCEKSDQTGKESTGEYFVDMGKCHAGRIGKARAKPARARRRSEAFHIPGVVTLPYKTRQSQARKDAFHHNESFTSHGLAPAT